MMTKNRWRTLMTKLEISESLSTYNRIKTAYNEKHRHYHTTAHIADCLKNLDKTKHLTKTPSILEIALWFHDVIYKPFSSTNEQDSADFLTTFLNENNINQKLVDKAYKLVIVTQHNQTHKMDNDDHLMVDIDLSILGSEPDRYNRYVFAIRREYKWVPDFLYKRKRKSLLQSFLEQKNIYYHKEYQSQYEKQARSNIQNELNRLNSK